MPVAGAARVGVGTSNGCVGRPKELHAVHALAPTHGGEPSVEDSTGDVAAGRYGPDAGCPLDLRSGTLERHVKGSGGVAKGGAAAQRHGGGAAIVAPAEHLPRGVDCACVTGAGADLLDDLRSDWHGDVAWLDCGSLDREVLGEHHCPIGVRDYDVVDESGVLVVVGAAILVKPP